MDIKIFLSSLMVLVVICVSCVSIAVISSGFADVNINDIVSSVPAPTRTCEGNNRNGADDWTMYRHDSVHTGHSSCNAPESAQSLWTRTTGDAIYSSPAVIGGTIYIGSMDWHLYALNIDDGTVIWDVYTMTLGGGCGAPIDSSPAVVDGRIFFGCDDFNVYALYANNGTKIWSYRTDYYVKSSPTVAEGTVFVGSYDEHLYALNESTGELLWKHDLGNSSNGVRSSPAVYDGMVFVGTDVETNSTNSSFYALDIDGFKDGTDDGLSAGMGTDTSTTSNEGDVVWKFSTDQRGVLSSPAVHDGKVFFGSNDGNVYALYTSNGTRLWNYSTGGYVLSSPALDIQQGIVYFGSQDGCVYALNETTGALIWQYSFTRPIYDSSPAVADGKVFIGTSDGSLVALDAYTPDSVLASGDKRVIWRYKTGGAIQASPAVADGRVFIGSSDKNIYAFGGPDLTIKRSDISISESNPFEGEPITISATVYNEGAVAGYGDVEFWYASEDNTIKCKIDSKRVFVSAEGGSATVTIDWDAVPILVPTPETHIWIWIKNTYPQDVDMANNDEEKIILVIPVDTSGWPMLGRYPNHIGYGTSAPVTNTTVWIYETKSSLYSSPVVAKGRVFIGAGGASSGKGKLYALSEYEGFEFWNYTVGSNIYSTPAFLGGASLISDHDKVFFASNSGTVYALDTNNGNLKWRVELADTTDTRDTICTSLVVVNGTVYIGVTAGGWGRLYALDEDNGTELWNWTRGVGSEVTSTPAVFRDKIYVCTARYYGFQTRETKGNGDENGEGKSKGKGTGAGGAGGMIWALDRKNGNEIWNRTIGGQARASPTVVPDGSNPNTNTGTNTNTNIDADMVYLGCDDGNIYALYAINGTIKWNYTTAGSVRSTSSVDAEADRLFVGSDDNNLYSINTTTGKMAWRYETGGAIRAAPAVADGMVFIGSYDGNVYALDTAQGHMLWSYETGSRILSSPALTNKRLFIGAENGNLYVFGGENLPPIAKIDSPENDTIYFTTDQIEFSTYSSYDPDGNKYHLTYNWTSSIDGELYSGHNASFTTTSAALSEGEHRIILTVADRLGSESTAAITITVFTPKIDTKRNYTRPSHSYATYHYGGNGLVIMSRASNPSTITDTRSLGIFVNYSFVVLDPNLGALSSAKYKLTWTNISIGFESENVPRGLNVSRLAMFYWDPDNGKWVKCEDTGVNGLEAADSRYGNRNVGDLVNMSVWANMTGLISTEPVTFAPGTFEYILPELLDADVDPKAGYTDENYRYFVTYLDADNEPPADISVIIDEFTPRANVYSLDPLDLTDLNVQDGKRYTVQISGLELGAGNHTYRFEANDATNGAIGDTLEKTGPRIKLNRAPKADAGSGFGPVRVNELFEVDGSKSYDTDDDTLTYAWDFDAAEDVNGDGNYTNDAEKTGPKAVWRYEKEGQYTVTLTVTDTHGAKGVDQVIVEVKPADAGITKEKTYIITLVSIVIAIIIIGSLLFVLAKQRKQQKFDRDMEKLWAEEDELRATGRRRPAKRVKRAKRAKRKKKAKGRESEVEE